jgi:hypothetical protein
MAARQVDPLGPRQPVRQVNGKEEWTWREWTALSLTLLVFGLTFKRIFKL